MVAGRRRMAISPRLARSSPNAGRLPRRNAAVWRRSVVTPPSC